MRARSSCAEMLRLIRTVRDVMRNVILLTLVTSVLTGHAPAEDVVEFLRSNCIRCHGVEKSKGDLRLDKALEVSEEENSLELWQSILDRVGAGEMPPDGEPQPSKAERTGFLKSVRQQISEAAGRHRRQTMLRRLNRAQFRNTLSDLLHLDFTVDDPTDAFPADDKHEGFDNLGETLQMSDFLLRQYLKVARTAVDRATFPEERPEPETFTLKQQRGRAKNFSIQANDPDRDYVVLTRNDERAPGDPRGQSLMNSREGAPSAGFYEFTFEIESKGRGTLAEKFSAQKRNDYPVYRPEDLHRFEIYITAPNKSSAVQTRPRTLVHAMDLPDNQRVVIRKRFWLPKSWRVEVGFGNGYWGVVDPILLVDPDFDLDSFRELPKREQNEKYGRLLIDRFEEADAPRINIYSAVETGPLYDEWPPASHVAVYGKPGQNVETHLREFATQAFRRPVTDEQIAPYIRLAEQSPEGVRTAIEAILCSPRFVYLKESTKELDDYAIASRLSYFLWNTMPDKQLMADAAGGNLRDPKTLTLHVDRLLADPRSDEFVGSFVWGWLGLQNSVEMAPDPMKYFDFHRNRLNEAMVRETNEFFRCLLTENLPVARFIDSDFTIINADLARHYGVTEKVRTTAAFQRVALSPSDRRGGLLGQTAVLTASANGVDTSPVVRGIWVLENLLGTPPSPPPPDVDIPEPDTRGDLTIREIYAKHRTVESCNNCHRRIDPLGFALENYDAIGGWRTDYESGHAIDASGRMPGGEKFSDAAGLKRIMLKNQDQFTRNLTSRLLTYATGRTMSVADRPGIDTIVEQLAAKKGGLRDLIHLVVTSRLFLSK